MEPKPVMGLIIEKSTLDKERKEVPIVCALVKHLGPKVCSCNKKTLKRQAALAEDARTLFPFSIPSDVTTSQGLRAFLSTNNHLTTTGKISSSFVCWPAVPLCDQSGTDLSHIDDWLDIPLPGAYSIE